MDNEQKLFRQFLGLVGKKIVVGVGDKKLEGNVTNAMFDSFILEDARSKKVIAFKDLRYFDEAES